MVNIWDESWCVCMYNAVVGGHITLMFWKSVLIKRYDDDDDGGFI